MATLNEILANPEWIPHHIDQSGEEMLFVRFSRDDMSAHAFLANQAGTDQQWVPIRQLHGARLQTGPVSFIFHSGFCRSTLLLRALGVEGKVLGLNEPEILNSLSRLPNPSDQLIALIIDLLSRPHSADEAIVIKPSNFQNRLVPRIMATRKDIQAILLTNALEEFLWAIVRKGLLGRQWGRQTYLVAAAYAGEVDAFEALIPGMTDLQVAALGWLLMQNWFETCQRDIGASRLAALHSSHLDKSRAATIMASAAHLTLGLHERDISAILDGPVFATDAKTGADYATKEARDVERSRSAVTEDEIREVGAWIGELARVSGLSVPLKQTLG